MRTSGIYKIINKTNGKYYVGSSNYIERRWRDHKKMLRGNRHDNQYLQNAWNKYGEDNFEFLIINKLSETELIIEEQKYLNEINLDNDCYNLSFIAGKIEMTDEVKKKIGNGNRGKIRSDEVKKKLSEFMKGRFLGKNNPMYGKIGPNFGKKQSEETKKKIGLIHKGKIVSLETKEKIKKSLIGRKQSEETKLKRSKSLKKFYNNIKNRINHGIKVSEGYKNMSYEDKQEYKEKIKKSWIIRKLNRKK